MATAPDWDAMLTEFLMRDSTTPTQLDALHRLLTMVSEHQPTSHLLPIDEAEEKLRYLGKLQKHWKAHYTKFTGQPKHLHKPLHPLIIATVMMTDLASLREFFGLAGKVRGGFFENWLMELMVVPCFIKTVMAQKLNQDDEALVEFGRSAMAESEAKLRAAERRQDTLSDSYEDKKKKKVLKPGEILDRDEDAKAERRMLDQNRCVILGTGNPEVCHIVPFSIGSNEEHRCKFRDYIGPGISCIFSETPTWVDGPPDTGLHSIFSEGAGEDDETEDDLIREDDEMEDDMISEEPPSSLFAIRCRKIFTSKIGVSDKSWNEICLNRQLHNWWGRGYFAFKPLGIDGKFQVTLTSPKGHSVTYTQIKLQFHWMPRQNDLLRGISEDVSPQELSSTVGKTYGDLDLTDSMNPVFALDRPSSVSHHVQTGDIFYVKVEPRYAERMLAAFRIQWAAIKNLAMAGGAESLDDVGDHPDYLDKNLKWLGYRGLTIPELIKEWGA